MVATSTAKRSRFLIPAFFFLFGLLSQGAYGSTAGEGAPESGGAEDAGGIANAGGSGDAGAGDAGASPCFLGGQPVPAGTPCEDGDLCSGAETCDGVGACIAGTPPEQDDGDPSTLRCEARPGRELVHPRADEERRAPDQHDQGVDGRTAGVGGEGGEHVGTAVQADSPGGCCCYPDLPPGNSCSDVAGPDQCGKELGGGQYTPGSCRGCSVAGPTIGGSGGGMGPVARMATVLALALALRRVMRASARRARPA